MSNEEQRARDAINKAVRTRDWCFTLNNPTEEERAFFIRMSTSLPKGISYIVYQEERGHDCDTTHFQGYLECTNTVRLNWLKNNFNARAHFERRRGTQEEAITYCKKEDTRVEGGLHGEYGKPRGQDARAARLEAAELKRKAITALDDIRAGRKRLRDIDSETCLQPGFLHAVSTFLSTNLGNLRKIQIITIVGATGIGKSYAAYKVGGEEIITYQRNGWFGGANTEGDVLLFDEFTGNLPLSELLKLLDGYPNQLPVKGGFYPARYTKVFITSNVMPEHWWTKKDEEISKKREGELDCLYRRIGYPGPNGEHPEYDNGCFIHIPDKMEDGTPYSVASMRAKLQWALRMIGIDIRDKDKVTSDDEAEEEETEIEKND